MCAIVDIVPDADTCLPGTAETEKYVARNVRV